MIGRVNDIYTKTDWGEGVSGLGFEIKEVIAFAITNNILDFAYEGWNYLYLNYI